jgi:hypothetical protein
MGRPRGGSVTKNTINLPIPPCLGEALRRGSIAKKTTFHGLGENSIGSYLFSIKTFLVKPILTLVP